MNDYRKLLTPTSELIELFNGFWGSAEKRETKLFENGEKIIIDEKMIPGINYFNAGDDLLNAAFQKLRSKGFDLHDVETAVYLLDGIYHTYLKDHLHLSKLLYQLLTESNNRVLDIILNTDRIVMYNDIDAIQCVDAIARINENREKKSGYHYSFSTKFCYWLAQDYFPIYDSIANGLLSYYQNINPKSLGDYRTYVEAYKLFVDQFHLEGCTIKQIDVFLWTYGKALASKEIQCPVAKYISYLLLDNNKIVD